MSPETATDPRIRPAIAAIGQPAQAPVSTAGPASLAKRAEAPPGATGGNRVTDHGPGFDHPTVEAELSFAELLDVINPLQHLPLVSNLYRRITGDEISTPARVMGATLYGGPAGFLIASATALTAEVGGEDPGDRMLAQLFGPAGGDDPAPLLAEGQTRGEQHPPAFAGGEGARPDAMEAGHELAEAERPIQPTAGKSLTAEQARFVERMMSALDKYQALPAARADSARPGPGGLDFLL